MAPKKNDHPLIEQQHLEDSSTMDDFNTFASPRPTLREEAAMRASVTSEEETPHLESFPFFTSPQTPSPSSHPLAAAFASTTTTTDTPDTIAHSARKEWRRHGSGVTQSLEETRRLDEERAGTITVRVLSAETRRDVSEAKYTAYILRVQLVNGQVLQMEHRYSEFAKLNEIFKAHHVTFDSVCAFPSKHWAGRMGNWTPSLKWAPTQHDELIQYRKIQLDVWLVHVVAKYNIGDLPHIVAKAVYDFLTVPDRPPCEQENAFNSEDWKKWNNPLSFTLGSNIRQATSTLEHMCHNDTLNDSDQSIPLDLLHCAKGLCFLTVIKAGLVVSGRVGTGLLIARLDGDLRPWSAPCALGTVGMGWGMLAGGDITHYLVVLTTHEAVEALLGGTVQLGAELGVAVGPMGRSATSHVSASNTDWAVHPAYSYAHSQGLFVGMSLEGSVLTTRHDVNAKFYGRSNLTPLDILDMAPPKAAEPLYKALERAMATAIPQEGFRPSQLFQEHKPTPPSTTRIASTCPIHGLPTVDAVGRVNVPSTPTDSLTVSPM
jgi:lipid-binding SYLF domain-containing protein